MVKPGGVDDSKAMAGLIGQLRKSPHNFAMLIGKDGLVLEADKKKSVDAMRKAAKASGGGGRGAWGTLRLNGKVLTMECEAEPPGPFEKLARKHFSDRGQKLQIEVIISEAVDGAPAMGDGPTNGEDAAPSILVGEPSASSGGEDGDAVPTDDAAYAEVPDDPDDEDDIAAQAGELSALIRAARKKPYRFAWMLGQGDLILKAHRRKPPEALIKLAKTDGGGARGAWGRMGVEGKWIVLNSIEEPPGSFSKSAKRWLKARGIKQGVILRSPAGEVSEAPDEDDAPVGEDEIQETLAQEFRLISDALDTVIAEADKGKAKKLSHFKTLCQAALTEGDTAKAQKLLTMLKTLAGISDVLTIPEYDPDAEPAMNEGDALAAMIDGQRQRLNAMAEPEDAVGKATFDAQRTALLAQLDAATTSAEMEAAANAITEFGDAWAGDGQPPVGPREVEQPPVPLHEQVGLSEDEAALLEAWAKDNSMAKEGLFDDVGGERLANALKGESDLGPLSREQQMFLSIKTAESWIKAPANPDVNLAMAKGRVQENIDEMKTGLADDPALEAIVARGLLHAYGSQQVFKGDYSVTGPARDISHEVMLTALDLDPERTMSRLLTVYSPKTMAQLATGNARKQIYQAVPSNPDVMEPTFDELSPERRNAVLAHAGSGAMPPADVDTMVSYMFGAADSDDVDTPDEAVAMSGALAHMLGNEADLSGRQERRLKHRLIDVVSSDGGQELLFDRSINPVLRNWALTQFAPDPDNEGRPVLRAADVAKGWESGKIANAYGSRALNMAKEQYPEPLGLDPNDKAPTSNQLGQLMNLPMTSPPPADETAEAREARLAAEDDHAYYDTSKKPMSSILEHLQDASTCPALVTPIPVTVTSEEFGAAVFRVLRVEGPMGPFFLDNKGNKFRDVVHWKEENKLPVGTMSYPYDLVLGNHAVAEATPRSHWTEQALDIADQAALAAGIVAGIAVVAGTGGAAAPAVAAAAAAYSTYRAGSALAEKDDLGHDIWDPGDAEIRGLWLDAASSALSVGAVGGGIRAARLAANGAKMSRAGANIVAGMQVAGNVTDAVAMGDSITMLSVNWAKMDEAQKAQALLSLSMQFGMGAAGRAKGGGSIADDFSFKRTRNTLEHGSPFDLEMSTDVPEGTVAVKYGRDADGNPTGKDFKIVYNSDHPPSREMIELHGRAASSMEASMSLRQKMLDFIGGRDAPPPGSGAWEALEELKKFQDETHGIIKKLNGPDVDAAERVQLEARIDEINAAIIAERMRLDDFQKPGRGYVAATQTGADQAKKLKYPDPPDPGGTGKPEYIWVAGNPEPRLRALHDDLPPCRWDKTSKEFVYEVNRGWSSDGETDFNWYANNPQPNARYEYENGATYKTDAEGRTRTVKARLQDDPWDRHAAKQRAIGRIGKEGNPGESYDGGHLIPRELGGAPGALNVVPMQSYLNQHGKWRDIEKGWGKAVRAGKDVEIEVEVVYYSSGNKARRATPKEFIVKTVIDGKAQKPRIIKNTSSG